MRRAQRAYVIQRIGDGLFYHTPRGSSSPGWTDDISHANIVVPSKIVDIIRAGWARNEDFRAHELVPSLIEEASNKCADEAQRVFVIQRISDGLFYHAQEDSSSPGWTDDLRLANFVAPSKIKGMIRAVWGRDEEDFRAVEVVPSLIDETSSKGAE